MKAELGHFYLFIWFVSFEFLVTIFLKIQLKKNA